MVSFSLRQRISYLLLQDPSLVSFHLIQFVTSVAFIVLLPVLSEGGNARADPRARS